MDYDSLQIDSISFWGKHKHNKGGMRVFWSGSMGWGTLYIVKNEGMDYDMPNEEEEGLKLVAYTEHMDNPKKKEFTKKIMELLIEKLIIVE